MVAGSGRVPANVSACRFDSVGDQTRLGHKRRLESDLKIKVLVQYQGGAEFQPAGKLNDVEDLKRGSNAAVGPKDYFKTDSNVLSGRPGPAEQRDREALAESTYRFYRHDCFL